MTRPVLNFSAGPAMLPEEIMQKAQAEFLDWQGTGKSVVEIGHRSDEFKSMAEHAEKTLREILNIPANYYVLFLAGGATQQFSVVPMNLLQGKHSADYLHTGVWSKKAMLEAKAYAEINVVCSGEASAFTSIPDRKTWQLNADAAYCYYCANETISGLEFPFIPECDVPLVTDMTSSILSRPIDVSRFGLIIAGAQKNIAPAGMSIVIVKEDLSGAVLPGTPSLFDYRLQAKANSMLNTPPTFNWYMADLMFDWVKQQGGVAALEQRNRRKAEMLYEFIDHSTLFNNDIDPHFRSRMNITFNLTDEGLNNDFLRLAERTGLHGLKGHRLQGGIRASMYNAMPESGVKKLLGFMQEFERNH